MSNEEQNYLINEIKNFLNIMSDEKEPNQTGVIDLSEINVCNPDYIPFEIPDMTPDDIIKMLHLDDPAINPDNDQRPKDEDESDTPLVDKSPYGEDPTKSDDGSGYPNTGNVDTGADENTPLAGDRSKKANPDDTRDDGLGKKNDWNDIKVPDDVDFNKVVDAIINDDTIGQNKLIIEFATPSLQDERDVDFKLYVQPGQQITKDTLIARATINGVTKDIRSIFNSGTVCATEDGSDFLRLYKGCGCDRHIIIDNYEICGERPDIDTDKIQEMCDEFSQEAYIHQLVTDNLPDCVLPLILQKRYTENKWISKLLGIKENRENGREIFSKYIDKVQDIRQEYMEDIQKMGTEDNIKKTNGNVRKINDLGWKIIDRRRKYAEDMIYMYREYSHTLQPCEFDDYKYYDCQYLAYDHAVEYRDEKVNEKIGNTEYSNYYVALLSKLDMANDTQNKYATEYFELLTKIINRRIAFEGYDINVIRNEFNSLYKKAINSGYKNAYTSLYNAMRLVDGDVTYSDVYNWITQHSKKGSTKKSDEYIEFSKRQLANIFLFLWNYHKYEVPGKKFTNGIGANSTGQMSIFDLTKLEWSEISEFWDKVLAIWERTTVKKCVQNFEEFAKFGDRFHEWPTPGIFGVGYDEYTHYLFQNYTERDQTIEDEDLGSTYEVTEPEIPDTVEIPEGEFDLKENEDDPQDGEISIIDFKYWVRYFALATIISIPYLNCGLDIMPFIQLVPLPCIFIAVASVYIKILDIVIVFGITIRGMYIFPCVLFVNLSSTPLSITTPLIAALKTIQSKINAKINTIAEKPINALADGIIDLVETDNRRLRNENKQLDAAISQMKGKKLNNQEMIKNSFEKIAHPKATLRQQVVDPIGAMFPNKEKENQKDKNDTTLET